MNRDGPLLHHVGLEVRPEDLPRARELWSMVGLREVPVPSSLAGRAVWFQSPGPEMPTQVHLLLGETSGDSPRAHVALVVPGYESVVRRLREAGFEVDERSRHWGSPRSLCPHPGGHTVELMCEPPTV